MRIIGRSLLRCTCSGSVKSHFSPAGCALACCNAQRQRQLSRVRPGPDTDDGAEETIKQIWMTCTHTSSKEWTDGLQGVKFGF